MKGMGKDADRNAAFPPIDTLKRVAIADFKWSKEWGKDWGMIRPIPRLSVPRLFDPVFAQPAPAPAAADLIPAAALCRRIAAQRALKKTGRKSPFRPGFAPGYH